MIIAPSQTGLSDDRIHRDQVLEMIHKAIDPLWFITAEKEVFRDWETTSWSPTFTTTTTTTTTTSS